MTALEYIKAANNQTITIMEVCGTHTAAIAHSGLKSLLPQGIRLVSGPGCPVCVTAGGFIDGVIDYAQANNAIVLSFGDMFRVKGSYSFAEARALGGDYRVIYSPNEAVALARGSPKKLHILIAVGFETTAPLFALALKTAIDEHITNIKFATSLKMIVPAMAYICEKNPPDGFICPGHVAAVIGANAFLPLIKYNVPLVIAGFAPQDIIDAIAVITRKRARVDNLYKGIVSEDGNLEALALMDRIFESYDAVWRGIGIIIDSGLKLRREYSEFAIPMIESGEDFPKGCRCADVLMGAAVPMECPLFNTACTPENPIGACMVSSEGACGVYAR